MGGARGGGRARLGGMWGTGRHTGSGLRSGLGLRRLACGVWRVAFGVWRVASGVWRLAFGIWRLAFGVWRLAFGAWVGLSLGCGVALGLGWCLGCAGLAEGCLGSSSMRSTQPSHLSAGGLAMLRCLALCEPLTARVLSRLVCHSLTTLEALDTAASRRALASARGRPPPSTLLPVTCEPHAAWVCSQLCASLHTRGSRGSGHGSLTQSSRLCTWPAPTLPLLPATCEPHAAWVCPQLGASLHTRGSRGPGHGSLARSSCLRTWPGPTLSLWLGGLGVGLGLGLALGLWLGLWRGAWLWGLGVGWHRGSEALSLRQEPSL